MITLAFGIGVGWILGTLVFDDWPTPRLLRRLRT
jgi:hypothetical protein